MGTNTTRISRRSFLAGTTSSVAAFSIVPGSFLGLNGATPPSENLNIAGIGVGGQGGEDLKQMISENIVALCDVDSKQASRTFNDARFAKAKRYQDFRVMLDEIGKDIDAVVVGTPDHFHAVAVTRALKMDKHVYCEKPLAHSIYEVREIMKTAREHKVTTQLGNQGHSFDSIRVFREWIEDGTIGTVREVHAMCGSVYSHIDMIEDVKKGQPVPETLNWDLWLGPVRYRPYHRAYVPGAWRGWTAFGTGVIGDWTCHVVDPVFWTLDLGAPTSIEAETGDYDPQKHGETFPKASIVRYEFPARGNRPAVKLIWYDGAQQPPCPEELSGDEKLPGIGALVIGDKGKILYGSHGANRPQILSESKMDAVQKKPTRIPKSPGHHKEWIEACKSGKPAGSHFEYGGSLTELALLGNIAMRMKGQKLLWDGKNMRFTNSSDANQWIKPVFREGWSL